MIKQKYLWSLLAVVMAVTMGVGFTSCGDDDEEEISSKEEQLNGKTDGLYSSRTSKSYLNCPDDNHPHLIDLGLPSGTKWACCNVDANKPEAYGGYYAWGEIEEKDVYNQMSYLYYGGGHDADGDGYDDFPYDGYYIWIGNSKYNRYGQYYRDIAGTQYDVAHVKWGGSWVMPSDDQFYELIRYCSFIWTTMNGVKGGLFTRLNGSTIFLPAAGDRFDNKIRVGEKGCYWSSSHNEKGSTWLEDISRCLGFDSSTSSGKGYNWGHNRYFGYQVRPISK